MLRKYGEKARLPVGGASPAAPCLRLALADQGADTRLIQVYLGHRNIQHTVPYTPTRQQPRSVREGVEVVGAPHKTAPPCRRGDKDIRQSDDLKRWRSAPQAIFWS